MTGNKQAKKGSSAWKGKGRGRDKKKRKQRPKLSEEEKMSRREEMEAKRTVEKKAADAKGRSNFMSLLLGKKQKERESAGSGGETEGIDGSDASSEDERSSDESEGGDGADIGMVGDEAIDNNPIECSMIGGHEDDDDDVECSMIGGGPEEKDDDDEDSITDYLDAVGGYSDVLDLPPVTAELDNEEEIDIDAEGDIDAADAGYDGGNEGRLPSSSCCSSFARFARFPPFSLSFPLFLFPFYSKSPTTSTV